MIKNISFGSTYRVNLKDNNNSWQQLNKFQNLSYQISDEDKDAKLYSCFQAGKEHITWVVDDKFDNDMETYLTSQNIKFSKYTTKELFSEEGIRKRLKVPNDNYPRPRYLPNLVNVNTERFDSAFKNSEIYLPEEDMQENPSQYDSFREYLKSAEDINAPEVCVTEQNGEPVIDFQDGRHRYAYMRNRGFKTIPVAMDAESLKLAIKYKLV